MTTTRPTAAIERLRTRYYNENAYDPEENPGGLDESEDGQTAGHVTNFPAALTDVGDAAAYVGEAAADVGAAAAAAHGDRLAADAAAGAAAQHRAEAAQSALTAASIVQHVDVTEIVGLPPVVDLRFCDPAGVPAG
ncbi:hypothetical protein [Azospirillum sp. INR13]|uniref:hypothetical protein n=1 Tax=Azospirillum sp. INR13 TaxID=2596919 RepID=UPI0018927799|nr:hypothetical protein [Azospirillum sp. INR13]